MVNKMHTGSVGFKKRSNRGDRHAAAPRLDESAAGLESVAASPRSLASRLLRLGAYALYVFVVCEVAARLFWLVAYGTPLHRTADIYYRFYPELRDSGVEHATIDTNDGTFDILLLGGSVLHEEYGSIDRLLRDELASRIEQPTRVFNLAMMAHTTRDSLLKYRSLTGKHFELVVMYHGINDVRMNNCPPSMFKEDYTHCVWYQLIETFTAHPEVSVLALPYTALYGFTNTLARPWFARYVSQHDPNSDWRDYGGDLKTVQTVRGNVRDLLAIAKQRNEKVLLMSFAYHVANDYSMETFFQRSLDYGRHCTPIEMWGSPEHVPRAIEAHNEVLRHLATEASHASFVDQNSLLPKDGRHFDDICHLTETGCEAFVANVVAAIVEGRPGADAGQSRPFNTLVVTGRPGPRLPVKDR